MYIWSLLLLKQNETRVSGVLLNSLKVQSRIHLILGLYRLAEAEIVMSLFQSVKVNILVVAYEIRSAPGWLDERRHLCCTFRALLGYNGCNEELLRLGLHLFN